MKPVKIGILGLGTVGCGTLNVLQRNSNEISRRAGREIVVQRAAVKNINKPRDSIVESVELTDDSYKIVNAPDIDIVVELIGGQSPAFDYLAKALENGKNVVTANKELIAVRGNELFKMAQQSSVVIAFEAAVAGGIPIIKALREGLAGNRLESVIGIINGTSNFILTGMKENNRSFNAMLEEAQSLGYAEADPTFDIAGVDAAHKLTILSSIAFGIPLQFESVYMDGIDTVTLEDIEYADELGFCIKPLAITRCNDSGIEIRVHPALISKQRLIANVNGVMNAIMVNGNAVGRTLYYGPGAGAEPTASAVVADLVDVVRTLAVNSENRVPHLAFQPGCLSELPVVPVDDIVAAHYLRMNAINKAGVLAEIARILGEHGLSIESILQKGSDIHEDILPVVIVTQETNEANMKRAIVDLESLDTVIDRITRIRIESLH